MAEKGISADQYDLGHVLAFDTSGVSSVGVLCDDTSKARGISGTDGPLGYRWGSMNPLGEVYWNRLAHETDRYHYSLPADTSFSHTKQ